LNGIDFSDNKNNFVTEVNIKLLGDLVEDIHIKLRDLVKNNDLKVNGKLKNNLF